MIFIVYLEVYRMETNHIELKKQGLKGTVAIGVIQILFLMKSYHFY